ncbi:MAG TPA: M28 family peptidase [Longimicrobiales bacterium]|nr:M28 family peptidase [Longimicrobiales bacterium]
MTNRTRMVLPLVAAAVLPACGERDAAQAREGDPPVALRSADALAGALATITADDVFERVSFLASDELRGRDTPSPGLDTAAAYIVREFERFGLEPAGDRDGFVQRYPYPLVERQGLPRLLAASGEELAPGALFAASPGSPGEGRAVEAVLLDLDGRSDAFAEAEGRVALVPLPGDPAERAWRIARTSAVRQATAAGARAAVLLLGPSVGPAGIERLDETGAAPTRVLGGVADMIPVFYVSPEGAARLFPEADVAGFVAEAAAGAAEPRVAGTLTYAARARQVDDATAPNVAGVLRGSDPELANTYLVFSAHMDHLGVGTPDETGDSIYNGADDDASGTSALLEIAEAFAALETPPARSVMFLAVSGEEKGLLGSRWFSDHPTVPVESIVANVNIDMIARNAADSIVVIGQEYSSLGPLVRSIATGYPELGLTVADDLWPEQRFFFRSDHFNFARHEIPALFFFAGVHEDYHRPSDEVDKIDPDKVARVGRLAFLTGLAVADDPEAPGWEPEGLEEVRALTR